MVAPGHVASSTGRAAQCMPAVSITPIIQQDVGPAQSMGATGPAATAIAAAAEPAAAPSSPSTLNLIQTAPAAKIILR